MKQMLITIGLTLAAIVLYDMVLKPMLQKQGLMTFENADEMEEI